MLLRILDQSTETLPTAVKIELVKDGLARGYVTDYDISIPSDDLRSRLAWYYSEYPIDKPVVGADSVMDRLIRYGQSLGQDVCGSFAELDELRKEIESVGYAQCDVELVSQDPGFWSRPWESLILPNSRYVLSSVARSFVRRPAPERPAHVDFHTPAEGEPLRVLRLLSRPAGVDPASVAFAASCDALGAEGALVHEVWHGGCWEEVCERLAHRTIPVHVLHFDGPIEIADGSARLVLSRAGETERVPVSVVARALVEAGVVLLSVDSRGYSGKGYSGAEVPVPAQAGLLQVAVEAQREGLDGILGLAEGCHPWLSEDCFRQVYHGCVRGLTLEQAVVEARKAFQAKPETDHFTARSLPFHAWPLLIHYSGRPVRFFSKPRAWVEPQESQLSQRVAGKLFGFAARRQPPLLWQADDGELWNVVGSFSTSRAGGRRVHVTGAPGTGKTDLAHRAGWYMAQAGEIDFGFYFDFAHEDYSLADLLDMIAPVLALSHGNRGEVAAKLQALRCYVVLDGLEAGGHLEIEQWVEDLVANGHMVVTVGRCAGETGNRTVHECDIGPLSDLNHRVLAAQVLRSEKLEAMETDEAWSELLASLRGNPWLTCRVLPLLHRKSPADLAREVKERFRGRSLDTLIEDFFEWQWSEMSESARRLLLLCTVLESVYLEVLAVALDQTVDQKETFQSARELLAAVGAGDTRFADLITLWAQRGFVGRGNYGHIMDVRAVSFLQARAAAAQSEAQVDAATQLRFSQCLCEGLRLTARGASARPGSPLIHHLITRRSQWAGHFERLWFAADFRGFAEVVQAFEPVLRQAGLEAEFGSWLLSLLERSPAVEPGEAISPAQMAWLGVAARVLALQKPSEAATPGRTERGAGQAAGNEREDKNEMQEKSAGVLERAACVWWRWLQQQTVPGEESALACFRQAAHFLSAHFEQRGEWTRCAEVCAKLCPVLLKQQAWYEAIHILHRQARCQLALGDETGAFASERTILEEIQFEGAPAGVRQKTLLNVLVARTARGVCDRALLERVRAMDGDREPLKAMLDRLESQIAAHESRELASCAR